MRASAGEHDQAFTEVRFREIRDLLDRAQEFRADVRSVPVEDGYDGSAVSVGNLKDQR